MKQIIGFFIFLLGAAAGSFLQAQNLDDVLDKHFDAVGQEILLTKKTYSVEAKVEQMGTEIPMQMKMKRPNKFRMEMEVQGQKMIQVYDGEKGWVIAPWVSPKPQELTGPQLDQAMDQVNIDGELYNFAEKGFAAELLGKEFLDDMEVYNIRLTGKDGTEKNYYIDTEEYYIRKVKAKVNAQGQEVTIEQNMSDYSEVEGVMIARKIESKSPMGTGNVIFEEVKFGESFDDAIFSKP